ncbi:MAG: hypothetical protein H7268_06105 [Sandarakinorhabdus sp.]|nr:hypothetical protein [Sandarakinorhabdus sp.]
MHRIAQAELAARSGGDVGCQTSGTMVREIRFQSAFSLIGITGWTFRVIRSPLRSPSTSGPMAPSKLNWDGTLISEATEFDSFCASAAASSPGAAAGASCAATGASNTSQAATFSPESRSYLSSRQLLPARTTAHCPRRHNVAIAY